jgi:hypothetical protein
MGCAWESPLEAAFSDLDSILTQGAVFLQAFACFQNLQPSRSSIPMPSFTTTFQHPFERKPQNLGPLEPEQVLAKFQSIAWESFVIDTFEKQDEVLEHFYFFEICDQGTPTDRPSLCLSGQYSGEHELQHDGPQFTIRYCVHREVTSSGFLGFGAGKTRTKEFQKNMQDCNKTFALQALSAFMRNDTRFLDEEILDNLQDDD